MPFRSPFATIRPLSATIALACAVVVAATAFAAPTREEALKMKKPGESDDIAAARLNEEGKALVRKRDYYKALELFQAALQLFPISNAIFNVGSMHYTLREYVEAFPYLEQTLRAPLSPEQREIVMKYRTDVLAKLHDTHKDILVQSNPPGAMVSVNGVRLPYPAPMRILIPYGTADITFEYPGFESNTVAVQSSLEKPPKDVAVRLKREEPYGNISVRCPRGADIFIDGTMKGFDVVRDRLLAGKHTVRCGKGPGNEAFERTITVRLNVVNTFDFSLEKE
ncbi:MAG: hypothetical protein RIT45_1736 [Pseudomonadota bacterium]